MRLAHRRRGRCQKIDLGIVVALGWLALGCSSGGEQDALPPVQDAGDAGADTAPDGGCTPVTCAEVLAECGTISDGCGETLSCGECSSDQSCGGSGPNRCGGEPCSPRTCAQLQASCGAVSDGCDAVVECGECQFPTTCGGGGIPNQCGCESETCSGAHVFSRIFGDASSQVAHGVAFDSAGNLVVAGNFDGTMDLGGGPMTSAGAADLFVAKFDVTGKHLWSKRFGDAAKQGGWSIAVDNQDNIFLAGGLTGSVSFGNIVVTAYDDSRWDVYILKLDPVGSPLWVYHAEAPGDQAFYSIAAGADGAVVAVGDGGNAVDFGGGLLGTEGDWNALVVKVDADGKHVWSRSFGEEEYQGAWGVSVDSTGNVYFTGGHWGPVDFGAGLVSSSDGDGFLVGLDPNGQYRWSKVFGEAGEQYGVRTTVDGLGNVLLTFQYEGTVNLGGGPLASHPVLGESGVAKFGPFGQHIWSKRLFNTATKIRDFHVAVDESGKVFLAGATDSSVDLGGGTLAVEGEALVVAKLDASGGHLWSKAFGAENASILPKHVVASHQGRFVIAGEMQGGVDFGGGRLESAGKTDAFLLHLAH